MSQEGTTIQSTLPEMRKIIPDEPLQADLGTSAALHVAKSGSSVADVVSPASGIAADARASEPSAVESAVSSDVIESVFASAIREGISPITERWVNSHQADLMDALGPIIRRWMDERLPKLVASVLLEELRWASTQKPTEQPEHSV